MAGPLRVAVAGVTGFTGRPVAEAIVGAEDLRLAGGVARRTAGRPLAELFDGAPGGLVHGSVDELVAATPCDVLVDYTSAAAVAGNVAAAIRAGLHVVVGSSGLGAEDYAELDGLAREHRVGVVASGNFSVMAALLQRFAAEAAAYVASWEIVDYAAAGKEDVPSGTARALAERLGEVRRPHVERAPDQLIGPAEARGASVEGTRVHSVRLPGYVVSTEVVFASPAERLVVRHDPGPGAEAYVAGTLLAIRRAPGVVGVVRGLDRLLGPEP